MTDALTPRQRLALSRAELMATMGYRLPQGDVDPAVDAAAQWSERVPPAAPTWVDRMGGRFGLDILSRWWRRHPVSSFAQLSTPLLESYAAKHPGRLLAYSAGTGAMLVILKPWRMLSAATVLALMFRTSDVAGLIGELVVRSRQGPDER